MRVPDIQTLEYEARTTSEDGTALWLFREPNAAQNADVDESAVIGFDEAQVYELLDLEGLLRVVHELHQVGGGVPPTARGHLAPDELLNQYGMPERIADFLSSHASSLSLDVRYTDHGMFVQKTP